MIEKTISQEFRLKSVNERRYYFFKQIDQNELMNNEPKTLCVQL